MHAFVHLFSKYLLRASWSSETLLRAEDAAVNKRIKIPFLVKLAFEW